MPEFLGVEFRHQRDPRLNTTDKYVVTALLYRARFKETICDRELARWLRCDRTTALRSRRKIKELGVSIDPATIEKGNSRVMLADLPKLGMRGALLAAQTKSYIERAFEAEMLGEHCRLRAPRLAKWIGWCPATVRRHWNTLEGVWLEIGRKPGRAHEIRVLTERERQPAPPPRKPPPSPRPAGPRPDRELIPSASAAAYEFDAFERRLAEKLERAAAAAEAQPP